MRAVVAASLVALLSATPAIAQTKAGSGQDITKDQYLERAKQQAAARFDKADTNRDGVLTADERRAARPKRRTSQ